MRVRCLSEGRAENNAINNIESTGYGMAPVEAEGVAVDVAGVSPVLLLLQKFTNIIQVA